MANANAGAETSTDEEDAFVYVFDRREKDTPEVKVSTGGLFSFVDFKKRVVELLGIGSNEKFVIATTNREAIQDDASWDIIDKGDTLYVLHSIDQELCAPAQERVSYLPHYDTIVKGGMYEYYASEGQNPLPYAFAELIDNALAATVNNVGPRNIELRLHYDDNYKLQAVYVIDNGKGMTPRQLNNWAIYRLSKFIRKDKRSKVNLDETVEEEQHEVMQGAPRSLNSDISYFGVGGKQAIFFIGNSARMITRPRGSQDIHELTVSKEEFEMKEKNHEAIYSGFIRNRKAGDVSHVSGEDEVLKKVIEEENERDSFTVVAIQGLSLEHSTYLKGRLKEWSRQLAHIYHYYLHGPDGNVQDKEGVRVSSPFKNINIQLKIFTRGQVAPRVIDLRDIEDDAQTLFVRSSASTFEFKAVIEGSMMVEGVLRYHPFLYDRETYPPDAYDGRVEMEPEDDHGYAVSDQPSRGRRPIFECFWNGRLIPYSLIDCFEWCSVPKKTKHLIPPECYNRISGVLWTDDNFQVSTNKLTYIDLELKLKEKQSVFSRVVNGQERRTPVDRELSSWLRECHEQHDKQIYFSGFQGIISRPDLPKAKQSPWASYKQVEWDGKTYKAGQVVKIMRTMPALLGRISRILLFGDQTGDVYATGGDLELIQEPKSLYNEVKIVPLTRLDRAIHPQMVKKCLEEEEAKLPDELVITWPEGNEVVNNEKRTAGKTIGDMKVEILNRRGEKISKLPGTAVTSKKLLVELKVIWHSPQGDQEIVSHISQHGKNWPYWFRKMENIKNLGFYTLKLQAVLNESGANTYAGRELPMKKLKFSVTESEPEHFTMGHLEGPFRVNVPFNIPLELQDEFGHPAKPNQKLKPVLEASGLELSFEGLQFKGTTLLMTGVVAKGTVPTTSGKNFNLVVRIPDLADETQSIKVRLLPGPPAQLAVEPTEELTVENGTPASFQIQVKDAAGNSTTVEGRQSVLCKFSGAPGLPSYSVECSNVGSGTLTGDPILLKKVKDHQILTAKLDIQGYRQVKSVERKVKVIPSGHVSDILLEYKTKAGEEVTVKRGEEIFITAGELIDNITFKLYDEAGHEINIDDKLAGKIKVNWTPKVSKDLLLQSCLPNLKAPTVESEVKYCQITVMDKAGLEFGFVLKAKPGEPSQMKCKCVTTNQIQVGKALPSDIRVAIKDKFGNDIIQTGEDVTDLIMSGEGLKGKPKVHVEQKGSFIVRGVQFEDGAVGRKEIQFSFRSLKDYLRLELVAGPPAKLQFTNFTPDQVVTIYNENKFPEPLRVQLVDSGGNVSRTPDIRVQLAKDTKLKLIPTPPPVRTNKEGQVEMGGFTVSAATGIYEIQPKAFLTATTIVSGPKLKISVQPDPTRPNNLQVVYDQKASFVAGEKLTDITVKVLAEDARLLEGAKPAHISLKLWKTEPGDENSLPNRTLSYGPDNNKKTDPGLFLFKERKLPEIAGGHNIMFVYYDGKNQLFSNVIHINIEPAAPHSLIPLEQPGIPSVSNTRNLASRTIIRHLKLELRDKFENHVSKAMNGSLFVEIVSPTKEKELPVFVGGTRCLNLTLAGGTVVIQSLALQENSPGKDGVEYQLTCTVKCNNIPKDVTIPPYNISFLFYNDAKKQSQMAELCKERDILNNTIRTYKSLFVTTEQLIAELKISVKEANADESKIREELRQQHRVYSNQLNSVPSVEKTITAQTQLKDRLFKAQRRMCGLQQFSPDPEILGKIGHLALVADDECARVLSWHMSSDMDCVVTMTTRKAKDIYSQTHGKQQVLPLDSIYRKNLTEWKKPLPHAKHRPNWRPAGSPVYARELLKFSQNEDKCKIVFAMLLGDTLILDTLDHANAYRQELVKFTHCPTILTRDGDRIRSNGKFGGLMNKALPIEKLRGAVFGAPLPEDYDACCSTIDALQRLKSAMEDHQRAREELKEHEDTLATVEMREKQRECHEAEKQLAQLENKLGVGTPQRPGAMVKAGRTPGGEDSPAAKRARTSVLGSQSETSVNGNSLPNNAMTSPIRQSKRIAAMTPGQENEERKKSRRT